MIYPHLSPSFIVVLYVLSKASFYPRYDRVTPEILHQIDADVLGFNEAIDQSARMRRMYMLVLSCVEEEGWSCLEKGSRV